MILKHFKTFTIEIITLMFISITFIIFFDNKLQVLITFTVKPVLTTTSEQWPPVNNNQPDPPQYKINTNFWWSPSELRPPWTNGHFLSPKGGRCTQVWLYHWNQVTNADNNYHWNQNNNIDSNNHDINPITLEPQKNLSAGVVGRRQRQWQQLRPP